MSIDVPDSQQLTAPKRRSRLGGRQKAAVLLVSLGPARAAEIFGHLKEDEIEALSLDMAKLSQVPSDVSSEVINELVETCLAQAYMAEGGVEYAREVLERAVGPDRARQIVGRLSAAIERRPFEFLRRTPPEQIHAFIRNEAPQTIALVIANLHLDLAAQVLALLEAEEQAEVAMRIGMMRETSPEVIEAVENVLRQRLSNVISQDYAVAGGVQSLAEILNHTDRGTERNVLDSLSAVNAELAEEVRMLLFTFEDIIKLDDRVDPARPQGGRVQGPRRRPARRRQGRPGADLREHVRARRRDARRGDGVHARPEARRRRGGAGPDRGRRPAPGGGGRHRHRQGRR